MRRRNTDRKTRPRRPRRRGRGDAEDTRLEWKEDYGDSTSDRSGTSDPMIQYLPDTSHMEAKEGRPLVIHNHIHVGAQPNNCAHDTCHVHRDPHYPRHGCHHGEAYGLHRDPPWAGGLPPWLVFGGTASPCFPQACPIRGLCGAPAYTPCASAIMPGCSPR